MNIVTGHFQIDRTFSVTKDQLWHLLTDPDARTSWGAPSDDDVLIMEQVDLREGGNEVHRCGPADDPSYLIKTHWYRLDTPVLACFSETVEAGGMRLATSLITYALETTKTGCKLTVDVFVTSFTGEDMKSDFSSGWSSALARLDKLAVGMAAA